MAKLNNGKRYKNTNKKLNGNEQKHYHVFNDNDEKLSINENHSKVDDESIALLSSNKKEDNNDDLVLQNDMSIKNDSLESDYQQIAELMEKRYDPKELQKNLETQAQNNDEEDDDELEVFNSPSSEEKKANKKSKLKSKKSLKKSKSKKPIKHKKSFKQRMKTIAVLAVLGVFTGSGLGVWYFNEVLRSNVNYNDYDISEYIVTADEVLQEVYGISSNQENWLETIRASEEFRDFTPLDLTASQNFILAEYNATIAECYRVIGNGQVETIATQSVYSEKNYDGNKYTFESISKGLMSIATCSTTTKGSNYTDLYTGSNIQPDSAEWGNKQTYTNQDYIALAGSTPDTIQPYIISDKTILSSTEIAYDNETGYYSFTLELDPIFSVLRYARQVRQTSGLSSYPEFNSVTQTITIDGDWNLISIDVRETYKVVAFGVPASCTGTLLSVFDFSPEELTFPILP